MTLEREIIAALSKGKDTVGKLDMLSIYNDIRLLKRIACFLAEPFRGQVDCVTSPEATGWILGTMVAAELDINFIGIRKGGKSPYTKERLITQSYIDYSKTQKELELRNDAMSSKSKVLLVDCWIETGETISACLALLGKVGCFTYGIATLNIEKLAPMQQWINQEIRLEQIGITITLPTSMKDANNEE